MTFTVLVPRDGCFAERAFIAEVLLQDRLGLEIRMVPAGAGEVCIQGEDGRRLRMPDRFFAKAAGHWLLPSSLPALPLKFRAMEPGQLPGLPNGGEVPVLFGLDPDEGPLVQEGPLDSYLALDVFGSAFFMLTRYEEVVEGCRDWAERFPAHASVAWKAGFLGRPVVDEYVALLWTRMSALWPGLRRRQSTYSLRLTHDLDWPYATFGVPMGLSLRKLAGDVLIRHCASLGLRRMRSLVAMGEEDYRLDPNNTFEFIMDTNERQGCRSVFYFISGHTGPGTVDGVYTLEQPRIRHLMRQFRDRGHELGIHPSFCTFRDGEALGRELANLTRAAAAEGIQQESWGGRQHYLRWEVSTTWRLYEQVGLAYDSTLGFADRVGFRCGTCHPYRTYDLQERHALRLVERPLVAMDGSIFCYMALPIEEAGVVIQPLVDQCRAYGGDFVLLWHNSRLLTPRERRCYQNIIAMAS